MADATFADLFGDELYLHYDASDASKLFTDAGGTSAASDGNEVKCIKPQADAFFQVNLTNANGPAYRSNYASSGYAALEFDGTNDVLQNLSTGIGTATRGFVLFASTPLNSGTNWCRGASGSVFLRGFPGTTSEAMQNASLTLSMTGLASGRRVTAYVGGANQSQIDALGFSVGNQVNYITSGLTGAFTLGAIYTGSLSQFHQMAFYECLVIGPNCEWGQVLRAAKILRNKWGITDPNALPQAASGGVTGFTGLSGVGRLGT